MTAREIARETGMKRRGQRLPTQRQLRIGEELRHALASILGRGDVRDPGLEGRSVTVTEVRVSSDLRAATVFVAPLGGDDMEGALAALGRARPFLRRRVALDVQLRYVPSLSFVADDSFDQADRIARLLAPLRPPEADHGPESG